MKRHCFLLMTALLLFGCSQISDQYYSKKSFTIQSFRADLSKCKRQNPSFIAIRTFPGTRDRSSYIDDAMVRECMKGKGYAIHVETK